MAESNYEGVEVRIKNCIRDRDNYDRLLSVFHTGTEVKRCLLEHFLRGKKINLFDWLTNLDQNFLQFEDVQRAVRRSAVIQVTDLESSTINTLLKNNCFLMFWDICLSNNKLEDILNSHIKVLSSIYQNAGSNQTFSSLSTEYSKSRLTKKQWELLFKTNDQSEINKERYCHSFSASKDITVSSLDNELNFVLLYTICPLFKSVDVVSECQIQITKIAVRNSELQKSAFDKIWDTIEAHIQIIGRQCNLSDYFKHKCEKIQHTIFNRTVSQERRKCILEDAFKIPDFIKDNSFCYCVRTELDHMLCEDNLNLARTMCGREIPILLVNGFYTKGAYSLGVVEQADKDMDIRKSVCSSQVFAAAQNDIEDTLQMDDIHDRIEKHNFLKLVQLITYIGKDVLVDVLKARLLGANFGYVFSGMKNRIISLLDNHGRQLLYPDGSSYNGDLSDLDISIIYTILRNLNTISPPVNGWGNMPKDDDRSVSANIDRMRIFKNMYVSHCSNPSLNENDFLQIWMNIRQCIIELGGTSYIRKIDTILASEINPVIETELCSTYRRFKDTERQNEINYLKIEGDLNEIKQHLRMTNTKPPDNATTPNGSLGDVPLELRIEGDNLPSAQEITNRTEDLKTKDVRITYAKEGSILVGLDVSPSAFYNVGKFLDILDTLLSSLLQMHPKYGNGHTSHVVVFVNFMDIANEPIQFPKKLTDEDAISTGRKELQKAIGRLCGSKMKQESDQLSTKIRDQTNEEIILEIKHSQNEIEELKQSLKTTKEELLTRVDEVPPKHIQAKEELLTRVDEVPPKHIQAKEELLTRINGGPPKYIQDRINAQIEVWKMRDKMFVSTRASDYVIHVLKENSCVTITAPAGVGKSFTARHAALVLRKEQYKIIPVYSPKDIRNYYQPGKQTVFIIDDICGNFIVENKEIESWRQLLPLINRIITDKQCKIIVCCRLQIYRDDKFNILSPFISCECNLISDALRLTAKEKTKMADMYFVTKGKNLIEDKIDYDCFPLLCYLYHNKKNVDVKDIFRYPFIVYANELDNLVSYGEEGNLKICSLVLCVLFNNRIMENWFDGKVTDEQRLVIEDTCKACRLNRCTSKTELKYALDTLDGTFIVKHNGIYSTIHDKLFDFIVYYFGKKMIECLIDHGNSCLINERFIFPKFSVDLIENIEFIVEIPVDYLKSYFKRLVKIWSAGRVVLVLNNANMEVSTFRQQFLQYLLQLEKSQQLVLSSINDKLEPGIIPLLFTCYQGYSDMVQWILYNEAEVSNCDKVRNTALFEAWSHKFSYILRSVHQWTNHVDLSDIYFFTPLYLAVVRGHTNIVQMLLLKNANVDLCFDCGFSTFLRAQQNDNNDMLSMLLEESPDKCILNGRCPLSVASKQGNVDIVRLLLEKNPTVDLRDNNGMTALYVACWKGHTTVVSMLLEKNPNVNLCNTDGNSPLFIASQEGQTDIVRLLLERNPNIDLCNIYGVNALYVACYYGHTSNVIMLLEKKPNVDLCHKYGCCHMQQGSNFLNIKREVMSIERNCYADRTNDCSIIIRSNACLKKRYNTFLSVSVDSLNVDSCHKYGRSPLHIPIENIENKETDIIGLFLERNPKVDICDMNGVTALYIASYFGYSTIVSVLLEKNPNVDLCSINGCSPLYKASQCGHIDVVRLLLEKNPNVDQCDINGFSPLLLASQNGFVEIVRLLLERNPDVNQCDNDGCSPLLLSSQCGHTDIVMLLLERNPSVDLCDNNGFSPLLLASQNGFTDIVRLLSERNPNVDLCDIKGVSPLLIASHNGFFNIVMMLLESNPNVDLCNIDGCSPLLIASENGHTGIVRLLLESNANVHLCNSDGISPLLIASQNKHTDIVRLLLERNPDVDLCDNNGLNPLLLASQNGSTNIVKLLLKRNPDVDLCETTGGSPLLVASMNGFTNIVRLLLERNPDVDLCNNDGNSPLSLASQNGHTDIVKLLLERNSCVDLCNKDGCSPLLLASYSGHTDIVRLLLERNPNIDLRNNDGITALWIACNRGHSTIVSMLLEKNPDTDLNSIDGFTPLICSCLNSNFGIAQQLIKHKSNHNAQTLDCGNALYFSAQTGNIEITKLLLENNANCNICIHSKQSITDIFSNHPRITLDKVKQQSFDSLVENESSNVKDYVNKKSVEYAFDVVAGSSPLHIACFIGWKDVVSCLLDHHANINLTKEDGTTPLFYASELGHAAIVRLLLEKGADTDTYRQDGKSPLNIATDNGHKSVIMMIQKHTKE